MILGASVQWIEHTKSQWFTGIMQHCTDCTWLVFRRKQRVENSLEIQNTGVGLTNSIFIIGTRNLQRRKCDSTFKVLANNNLAQVPVVPQHNYNLGEIKAYCGTEGYTIHTGLLWDRGLQNYQNSVKFFTVQPYYGI